jgi:uncharacterized protein YcfJ
MKYLRIPLASLGLVAVSGFAQAAEYGTVVASTAVMAQVSVQQQLVQPRTSGGGALVGALIGGVVGHNLGSGFGRAAATGVGVVAGAAIGDRTEAANTPSGFVPVRSCQTFTSYENRVVAYDVSYDYNGQRHVARLSQAFNPGESIPLNVNVSPVGSAMAVAPPPPPPAVTGTTIVYTQGPAYGHYGYGGPVFIEQRRHGHGHWR